MEWKKKDILFEHYDDILLAETLREFFGSVKNKKGEEYSKSSMINLRAGLNRFLRNPPNKRIINLMENEVFQNANQVFKGKLRRNKKQGLDISKPRSDIDPEDLEKLYVEYFIPGLERGDTEVLMHKVFFDIMFHTGRRAKEGLRQLDKNSFDLKVSGDGLRYIEINFNEVTKKNQGDGTSSGLEALHNNHAIIAEQPNSVRCPVNSFIHYMENLNEKCDAFFQYPDDTKRKYDKRPVGKNILGMLMKTISEKANLSKMYTNHCIRKTTATGLRRQGFDLKDIANVTKHKNLQSLEHYIGGPTHQEKENYSDALFTYSHGKRSNENTPKQATKKIKATSTASSSKECERTKELVQYSPLDNEESDNEMGLIDPKLSQNVIQNHLRQAASMFQNATFNNCTINFKLPE